MRYFSTLFCLLSCLPSLVQAQIINEIHCAAPNGSFTEFVEIYNPTSQAIDLSGWRLSNGIKYQFPSGTMLAANQYLLIAQDPAKLSAAFELAPNPQVLGPYKGRLQSDDEKIELRNPSDSLIDKVSYQLGFPYPSPSNGEIISSLQLCHPDLDNNQPASWRSAAPSPGAQNAAVWAADGNLAPAVDKVWHQPAQPKPNEKVKIYAQIQDPQGVAKAEVLLQVVSPGAYIELRDAAFENPANWKAYPMYDDGSNGDSLPNDGVYTAQIPANEQVHRRLMRYRVVSSDSTGKSVRLPYADDSQPNFAYFVYNKPPNYAGYDFGKLRPVPICQLIAKAEDVDYNINRYNGDSYKSTGTMVYNQQVYDHIGFRSRGYRNRHARNKRNLKFNFNRGHRVETLDNYGRPYPTKRDKWVISGTWLLDKPYTHGLAEMLTYKLFNLQGAPATTADYIHLRVIDSQTEIDTFSGDFWGLYLIMENFDKDFLDNHQLPNGNIYSYKPPKMRNQLPDTLLGLSNPPYKEWDTLCERRNSNQWWRSHLELQHFFGFVATQDAINNRETGYRKQHWWMEYHNPKSNLWTIFPWDMDVTWTSTLGNSSIAGAIRKAAFFHPSIQAEYDNHLRSFLDLLYNEEQMNALINECAGFIYQPKQAYSLVDLDRTRWGHKYQSFEAVVFSFRKFVTSRRAFLMSKLPKAIPNRPQVIYTGEANFPTDKLSFQCGEFVDTSSQFAAMEWRLAEVSDPNNPFYQQDSPQPTAYEISAVWTSGEINHFNTKISIPAGIAQPNRSYRLRVRFKNKNGYCSHWSDPVQFIASPALESYTNKLLITEILYHFTDSSKLEFVELKNISETTIDLYQFAFTEGVKWKFEDSQPVPAGGYVVICNDAELFKKQFGFSPQGVFKGSLANEGELLVFSDPMGRLVDSILYQNKDGWDKNADGLGFSLEWIGTEALNDEPSLWRASPQVGGSPSEAPSNDSSQSKPANNDPLGSSFSPYEITAVVATVVVSIVFWLRIKPPKA